MKKILCCVSVFYLVFLSSTYAFGYLGKSIRIMALGDHLAGIVADENTDIYRNPAYLSFVDDTRIFGQYNLYGHTELKIAPNLTNERTGLLGLAVPLSPKDKLAIIGEIKPSTSEDQSSSTKQSDYTSRYNVYSSSGEVSTKKTIENFKVAYSRQLSEVVRVGADFTYLKNYNRQDSRTATASTDWEQFGGQQITSDSSESIRNSEDSPDAQRFSFGAVLSRWQGTTIDFTLYHENLTYAQTVLYLKDREMVRYYPGSTETHDSYRTDSRAPTRNRTAGLDVNLRRDLPHDAALSLLMGVSYGKFEYSFSQYGIDTMYSNSHYSRYTTSNDSRSQDDRTLYADVGVGVEKDFSSFIKVAAACRTHWRRDRLDHQEQKHSSSVYFEDDSVTSSSDIFESKSVNKTANSYEIAFPFGAEIAFKEMIRVRFGAAFVITREEGETGHSTSSQDQYYQGVGLSYDDRIFLDAYIKNEMERLQNWMVKMEYRF